MPGGRPSKYKPELCEKLIDHLSQGFSFESFAAIADVAEDTLYEWLQVHPEFSDSKKLGTPKGRLYWEKQAKLGLWVDKDSPAFNATVWIFSMKNRFGWRDKQDIIPEKKDMRDLTVEQKRLMLAKGKSALEVLEKELEAEEREAVKVK